MSELKDHHPLSWVRRVSSLLSDLSLECEAVWPAAVFAAPCRLGLVFGMLLHDFANCCWAVTFNISLRGAYCSLTA